MADVAAYDRLGNQIMVPEADVPELEKLGGRVATSEEISAHQLQSDYDRKSTVEKAASLAVGMGPPTLEAYREGANVGFTAGIGQAVTRQALDAIDPDAGAKYAKHVDDLKTAHPGVHTAGEVAGITGQVAIGLAAGGGPSRLLPANAVGALGGPVESVVMRALSGVAARGALGRAATTGAALAVRGAVEGAAYAGVQQAAENVLHDEPIVGEKLYSAIGHGALSGAALGGALGTGGSLLASGARGAAGLVRRGVVRAASRAEGAASDATAALSAEVKPGAIGRALSNPEATARGLAADQAWSAVGGGFGLQSTKFAKQAQKYFPGGTRDLGETILRHGILEVPQNASPWQAAWQAAKTGTPAEMLPRIEIAVDTVGRRIGAITEASGARIPAPKIMQAIDEVAREYESAAATRPAGRAVRNFGADLLDSLGLKSFENTAAVQDVLRERKAIDRAVFQDAQTLDPKVALEARRSFRTKLESIITDALDEASGKVSGEVAAEYKALKSDYHKLRIIEDAATDSAARSAKHATFGLAEKISAGTAIASGHIAAAPVIALGGKILKERGSAAAAAFISRAADTGAVSKLVREADELVSRASRGVLREPATTSPRARLGSGKRPARQMPEEPAARSRTELARRGTAETRSRARRVVEWVGRIRANPEPLIEALKRAAEIVGQQAGPKAAGAYTMASLRAIQFLVAHVPVKDRRDPLDPRSVPPMTYEEAKRAVRAAEYATRPASVWEDFERGKVTPEGILAAQTFMPDQYAEFQRQLLSHVTEHIMRNGRLTQSRRLQLSKLGIPAGGDLRPNAIARLQSNHAPPAQDQAPPPGGPPAGNGPVNMKIQQSGFDAVEARKSG